MATHGRVEVQVKENSVFIKLWVATNPHFVSFRSDEWSEIRCLLQCLEKFQEFLEKNEEERVKIKGSLIVGNLFFDGVYSFGDMVFSMYRGFEQWKGGEVKVRKMFNEVISFTDQDRNSLTRCLREVCELYVFSTKNWDIAE